MAQIYRTWKDGSGQEWINACWYYRPEQTVHRHDKHFFEHEVVKTGQYRDHRIEEIVDRCFVMFITRFPKGRPRGLPSDKAVYVCEARYNEERFRFNKIKTWASCVPDEVRERDYEMDLFDVPRRLKKVPSPIKHLLQEDSKETDALPKPTWGSPNAPPMIGAVHRRPREANVRCDPISSFPSDLACHIYLGEVQRRGWPSCLPRIPRECVSNCFFFLSSFSLFPCIAVISRVSYPPPPFLWLCRVVASGCRCLGRLARSRHRRSGA